ncbi:hypothetical protein ACT7DJ_33100 [Bacillus cereus]
MKRLALSKPIIEPTDSPNKIQPISAFDTANISRVVAVLEIHVAMPHLAKQIREKEHFERQVISFYDCPHYISPYETPFTLSIR